MNAALSNATGVAIKNELNKNEIALNDYFIIKPSLLRALHDSDPHKMIVWFKMGLEKIAFQGCIPSGSH